MSEPKHSFFEGPEKKLELVVESGTRSLRSFGRESWQRIVAAAQASVLSVRSNDHFDAYLLSESSLFVYDEHATMITCGQTRLDRAALALVEMVGIEAVALFVYERKNEHFPTMQSSTFLDDASLINQVLPGRALRFGTEHDHRIEMFVSGESYRPDADDVTLEVLMHGLDAERAAAFHSAASLRTSDRLGLAELIPGPVTIDEFAFDPAGYSLNALAGGDYYTVHVTPEAEGSYASFETNWDFRGDPSAMVTKVVAAFKPESFDVFAFAPQPGGVECVVDGYLPRKQMHAAIAGYDVSFRSFFRPRGLEEARSLSLP